MAPSKDTTMSASSSSQIRKRKGRADSPSSSNDTASVPAPVKTVQATNGTNGTNGVNGNGVAALKAGNASKDFITGQTVLNGKNVSSKTQIEIQTEIRSFECVKHVKPAQFPEVLGALPFPQELRSMVAWTDAYVQRLGWMALLQEQVRLLCAFSGPLLKLILANHRTPLRKSSPLVVLKRRMRNSLSAFRNFRPECTISLMTTTT
jgi:hypothetical protein